MPQDAYTLKYLCKELNSEFKNGKINRIVQPDNDSVIFTVYNGEKVQNLLISANPSNPRIGISSKQDAPLTAPNFCMLLRKYLLSAKIKEISLIGFDRIVKIVFIPSNEFFDEEDKIIYAELMGRYSNIILTENGKVLGANRGINFFDNGVRPLIVGKNYVYPPTNQKKEPCDKSLIETFDKISGEIKAEDICAFVQGLSISSAQEIVKKYYEKYGSFSSQKFFVFLNDFIENSKPKPCVIYSKNELKDVCVYPYDNIGEKIQYFDRLLDAENFFFSEKDRVKTFKEKKDRLLKIVNAEIKKVKKKLSFVLAREKEALNAENDRIKGELILSNIYKIPNGASKCVLDNYYDNTQMEIALDEKLSPSKNAEKYYKKYNKEKRTLIALEPQKNSFISEIDYLESLLDEINLAEDIEDVIILTEEVISAGLIKVQNQKKKKTENVGYRTYLIDGFTVKVGRNNAENEKLTFTAKPDDIWVHAKDYHSSHLIIVDGDKASQKVILTASEICAYFSKGRDGGKMEVVYTKRKNVKKPPKSKLGFCTYSSFMSVMVKPDKHLELLK